MSIANDVNDAVFIILELSIYICIIHHHLCYTYTQYFAYSEKKEEERGENYYLPGLHVQLVMLLS